MRIMQQKSNRWDWVEHKEIYTFFCLILPVCSVYQQFCQSVSFVCPFSACLLCGVCYLPMCIYAIIQTTRGVTPSLAVLPYEHQVRTETSATPLMSSFAVYKQKDFYCLRKTAFKNILQVICWNYKITDNFMQRVLIIYNPNDFT